MQKLSHKELLARQESVSGSCRLPIHALLNDIRSLYNVGSMFRTADGMGLEKLWLCGITGIPPDTQISKTALGAEKSMPWEYRESARACIEDLKARGFQIVLLEQTRQSVLCEDFVPKAPLCLVLGNETGGVSEDLLGLSDAAVEIGMAGVKNSLNVSVAFGIAAHQIRLKLAQKKL